MTSERVPYSQAGRMMAVSTPLGTDVLLLTQLAIDERVNALFEIQAAVKAQRDDLQAGDLVGATVDFRLKLAGGGERWWNGFVTHMHEGGLTNRGTRSYAMTVRPKLWLLTQKSDCRIFQGQTTTQVIETFMSEHGITDFILRVVGKLTPLDYSVQWNETDLDYMLRRMEQDGLYYYFAFGKGKHTFVVSDHPYGYDRAPEEEVRYAEGSAAQDHINKWRRTFAFTPGRRASRDWNFLSMATPTGGETSFAQVPGNADYELYEFPGRFTDSRTAEAATKSRIQATETGFETVEAASTVRTLGAGLTFTPVDVAKPANTFARQVVTAMRHVITDPTYETGGGTPSYDNTFTVMPADKPATPHRTQRRPRINGSQIALIAGPAGEEIFTDQYGRVKVWFPWDRRAKKDGTDTCWIRVGQPWAGGTWGHQVIPRVGMECLCSYQEGDPDRPFVTALVPDPRNPTPYPLPDNKTRMTFRSNSYKSTGFNEMTFEDKTGGENMFFHAQKDHTTKIENNQTNSVGANHSQVVGKNQSMTVGENLTFEAGKSINFAIGGTGKGVASLMVPVAGLAGVTASMLAESLGLHSVAAGDEAEQAARSVSEVAGGAAATLEDLLVQNTGTMSTALAGSLIGLLDRIGTEAQQQVWHGPSPRPDAGTALATAGAALARAVEALFELPGMHNHITGTMKTEHVGCARIEQVGSCKVTNVGVNQSTRVGHDNGLSAGRDINLGAGRDYMLHSGRAIGINASQNIMMHAGHGLSLVSDDQLYGAALNDIVLSSKRITLNASDEILLGVGDANSISIKSDGTVTINAATKIVLDADERVTLQSAGACLNVGGGQVLSTPHIEDGGSAEGKEEGDAPANAQKVVEQVINKITDWRKWLAIGAGYAAKKSEETLHWYAKGKKYVEDIYKDQMSDQTAQPSNQNIPSPGDPDPPGYVSDGHGGSYYDPSLDSTRKTP